MWARRPKWEKNTYFIRFLHAMGKELLLCSFIGRLCCEAGVSGADPGQNWNLRMCWTGMDRVWVSESHSVVSNFLRPHRLYSMEFSRPEYWSE